MLLDTDQGGVRSSKVKRESEGPGALKSRKLVTSKVKKEEEDAEVEPWWPPFEFNR